MKQADLQPLRVKWIFDPGFHYTPSYATDLRKTFERIRRQLPIAAMAASQPITLGELGS